MANRIVTICERAMTTTVNDIEHLESRSYRGVAVIRVYFQPNANVEMGIAQVTAINQTLLRTFPPGTFPPLIVKYDASSVPILQLGIDSDTLTEQQLRTKFYPCRSGNRGGGVHTSAFRRQDARHHGGYGSA